MLRAGMGSKGPWDFTFILGIWPLFLLCNTEGNANANATVHL